MNNASFQNWHSLLKHLILKKSAVLDLIRAQFKRLVINILVSITNIKSLRLFLATPTYLPSYTHDFKCHILTWYFNRFFWHLGLDVLSNFNLFYGDGIILNLTMPFMINNADVNAYVYKIYLPTNPRVYFFYLCDLFLFPQRCEIRPSAALLLTNPR